jgi:predicted metal-dependent hydrolase
VTTEQSILTVQGQEVDVVRKKIKNLHLSVYPPDGRVRVACPLHIDDDAVRLAVARRFGWIRRQQRAFDTQERISPREYVTGESMYFAGRRYRLLVVDGTETGVVLANKRIIRLTVRKGASQRTKANIVGAWQKNELARQLPALIAKWEPLMGVEIHEWVVQKMSRKWGTCNSDSGRVRLNVALARVSPSCLEYVVVHEMAHMLERTHGPRFQLLLDGFLPDWRMRKAQLSDVPLES